MVPALLHYGIRVVQKHGNHPDKGVAFVPLDVEMPTVAKQRKQPTIPASAPSVGIPGQPGWQPVPGVKLLRTLDGHKSMVLSIAFDPEGRTLASGSDDRTVKLWEVTSGKLVRTLEGHYDAVISIAFDPEGRTLASGSSSNNIVKLWEATSGKLIRTLKGHYGTVRSVVFDPEGRTLASGSADGTVILWEATSGKLIRTLERHRNWVNSIAFDRQGRTLASGGGDIYVKLSGATSGKLLATLKGHMGIVWSIAFDPEGRTLASGSSDKTVKLWETTSGKLLRTLEGHTNSVEAIAFSADGRLLASKSGDGTIRLWSCETWETVAVIPEPAKPDWWIPALAFHPTLPLLATAGSDPDTPEDARGRLIHLWELNLDLLLGGQAAAPTVHYVNAKVVLVGDTGVGKSGLSLVLNGEPFEATESTPGRHVWTFDSREVALAGNRKQTRETLLWDLAGQPGYRVIHQLHLNEVSVALVVFDARSETDPLAGVRHWERALRLAHQRQGSQSVPMKKFLVSARSDRGTVSVSKERLESVVKEFGFDGYFETSAKEGWQIQELRAAIETAIPWDDLPVVTSEELFARIKAFLLKLKETGRLLAPATQLYDEFAREHADLAAAHANLSAQFETCIGRLENRDLIRRLSFGGYVLLQPELLDAYASAMVNAAKNEPDGLGSIAEDAALAGQFFVPSEQKVGERGQEQLLLNATVEELARHDLALRESASDGRYLVFPSQFNRDYEDAPEPPGKALAVTFDGPVQSLYSTLAVRLGHSGLFTTGRAEMWRNAAVFTAKAGGKCGLYLHEFAEARGRLVIFYDQHEGQPPSDETRFHFEEFVLVHAQHRSLEGTVELVRFFVCPKCGTPVPDAYVKMLREQKQNEFQCFCPGKGIVALTEPKERLHFPSKVAAMEQSADRQRDFDVFVESARGETSTPSFKAWAGGERVTLAIVFTDVVGSTALGHEVGDAEMNDVRRAHFAQGQKLLGQHNGREIKTIGDSFMVAFKSVEEALDFALALQSKPGHPKIQVRAGIHVGVMQVEGNDVFGGTVNFAARVVGAIKDAEIWLSDRAKEDIVALKASRHSGLKWQQQDAVVMKGFPGTFTLWALRDQASPIKQRPATSFDVFLSHNSQDKPTVRVLRDRLVELQLKVWFDEEELRPGIPWQKLLEEGIKNSASVAVLVGQDGLGPWEDEEMQGALSLAVKNKRPVIPVVMPGASAQPELPMFLGNRTWVDLRNGFDKGGLDKLVWGITGKKRDLQTETIPLTGIVRLRADVEATRFEKEFAHSASRDLLLPLCDKDEWKYLELNDNYRSGNWESALKDADKHLADAIHASGGTAAEIAFEAVAVLMVAIADALRHDSEVSVQFVRELCATIFRATKTAVVLNDTDADLLFAKACRHEHAGVIAILSNARDRI